MSIFLIGIYAEILDMSWIVNIQRFLMVPLTGIEPVAQGLGIPCSIHLSYKGIN